eukprot:scaffold51140_cov36-Tisochrysis_lutea.AAC.2
MRGGSMAVVDGSSSVLSEGSGLMDRVEWLNISSGSTIDCRLLDKTRKPDEERIGPVGRCTFGALGGATDCSSRNRSSEPHSRSQRSLADIGKLLMARSDNDSDPRAAVFREAAVGCLFRTKLMSTIPRSFMTLDSMMVMVANVAAKVSIAKTANVLS